MAAPARKASGPGALQPRAQKGRVRRAVRISSLVAQEVGDSRPLPLPSRAGTLIQDAAQRSLSDSGSRPERASARQDRLGSQRVGSLVHPTPGSNWLLPRPSGAGWPVPFWPGLPFPRVPVAHSLLAQHAKGEEGQEGTGCPERMAGDGGRRGTCLPPPHLFQWASARPGLGVGLHHSGSSPAGGGPEVAASEGQVSGLESEEGGVRDHWLVVRAADLRHLVHLCWDSLGCWSLLHGRGRGRGRLG